MEETLTLPHDREIEQALISCILRKGKTFPKLAGMLAPRDFYHQPFGWAWAAFQRIHENGLTIDTLTFSDQLRRDGHYASFEQSPIIFGEDDFTTWDNHHFGSSAIASILTDENADPNNAESYARRVKQFAGKRKLVGLANRIADWSYNGKTPQEITQEAEQELIRFSAENGTHLATVRDTRDIARDAMDTSERRAKCEDDIIKSGFIDLDNIIGGYEKSNFIIYAGRPGTGKSVALITSALHGAERGKRTFMWSGEMSAREYAYRFIAQIAADKFGVEIPVMKMKTGKMEDNEWPGFYQAAEYFATLPIWMDETSGLRVGDLKTLCRRQADVGMDIVYIDHAGLMHPDGNKENRTQEMNYISRSLKEIALELDIPLVSAVQLNRAVEKRASHKPILSDINEGGNFEQDANIVIFVHEPDDESLINMRCLSVAKNRDGQSDRTVMVLFNGKIVKFQNVVAHRVEVFA